MNLSDLKAAYVLIKCKKEWHKILLGKLLKIDGIDNIQRTLGEYDIIVRITGGSENKIKHQIRNQICQNQEVKGTLTLICKDQIAYHDRVERLVDELVTR